MPRIWLADCCLSTRTLFDRFHCFERDFSPPIDFECEAFELQHFSARSIANWLHLKSEYRRFPLALITFAQIAKLAL